MDDNFKDMLTSPGFYGFCNPFAILSDGDLPDVSPRSQSPRSPSSSKDEVQVLRDDSKLRSGASDISELPCMGRGRPDSAVMEDVNCHINATRGNDALRLNGSDLGHDVLKRSELLHLGAGSSSLLDQNELRGDEGSLTHGVDGIDEEHVSQPRKGSKLYKNTGDVFCMDEDEENNILNINEVKKEKETVHLAECQRVGETGLLSPCYLQVTQSHLNVLVPGPRTGTVTAVASHHLSSIVKITRKKRQPEGSPAIDMARAG